MNVSVTDAGTCRKKMSIEVPAEALQEERAELLKIYTKTANIPGFRKGKAPKHLVEKKYAKDISRDIEERILPRFYHQALQESELKVVNVLDVSEINVNVTDQPLNFEVTIDIEPEFSLPKYEGISLKEDLEEVTDSHVQEQLDALLNQYASYEDAEDRIVETGDMAQIKYEATTDGKPLTEVAPDAKGIGSGKEYWISADEHAFLPGMGEAIIGLKIGDSKEVEVNFPEDFMVKALAGIKAIYQVEITGVRVRVMPTLNEEFLKQLQVESEDQLRNLMREQLEQQAKHKALGSKHEQIVKFLLNKTKMDVPESQVQQRTRNMFYEIAQQRMMAGMTQEQIAEQQEDLMKEAEARALENVKLRYIGLAIANEQKFEAVDREVNEEIANMAIRQRKDAATLKKEMQDEGTLSSVADQIRFNKALDYMIEKAKIK